MEVYYENLITVMAKVDIGISKVYEEFAKAFSFVMLSNEKMKSLHSKNCFKNYTFNNPYPIEQDKLYHAGRIYMVNFRTPNLEFAVAMKAHMVSAQGCFKVLAVELRQYELKPITKLLTLTPVVSTVENRCWVKADGIGLLSERLHSNAVKKAKALDESFTEPPELFFERVELLNEKPIVIPYKNTSILAHKLRLCVKPDSWAQELAATVLACGALEKNSLGFGYLIIDKRG